METQTFSIERYIQSKPSVLTEEQKERAWQRLEKLAKDTLPIEKLPETNIRQALAHSFYQQISLEFLRISQKKSFPPLGEFRLPRFGIYNMNNPEMAFSLGTTLARDYVFELTQPKTFPDIILKNIASSTDFGANQNGFWERAYFSQHKEKRRISLDLDVFPSFCPKRFQFPEQIRKRYSSNSYEFKSTFYGILPVETKAKINESKKIFGDDIFITTETAPEDWSITKELIPKARRDSLVIGVLGEKCYLIDKFNTTPLEDYITQEFSA